MSEQTTPLTVRAFRPREQCRVNGYLVEIERHARRTSFVRVLDTRLPGRVVVQLDRNTPARLSVQPTEKRP